MVSQNTMDASNLNKPVIKRGSSATAGDFRSTINDLTAYEDENEAVVNVWGILNALRKWWWLIVIMCALAMALTALVVSRMTPVYSASSVLEIKQKEMQIFSGSEVGNIIADAEFFSTQIELLKSGTLAEDVIESLNLSSKLGLAEIQGETRTARKGRAGKAFLEKLSITPVGRSRLIKIKFEHIDPRVAANVANAVTDTFVTYNMKRKYNATSYARDFVEERLKSTKEVLEYSERELVKYASENNLLIAGGNETKAVPGYLDTVALISLNAELTSAHTKRVEHEKAYILAFDAFEDLLLQDNGMQEILKKQLIELNAEYAKKLAIYKPEFPEMTEMQYRIDYLTSQIEAESNQSKTRALAELKTKYELALGSEVDLQSRVNELKQVTVENRSKSVDYNILEREVSTNRTQYDALLQRLKEISISDDIGSNLVSLVDRAKIPTKPFRPNKQLALLAAFAFGLVLGSALVFAIEMMDDRIKTPDDIKRKLKRSVMGIIPAVNNSGDIIHMLNDPQSEIAEAYASLRTNLQFSGPDGGPQVIHITSTRSGEGKSISSLGIATRFAGLSGRVLLIDADMRLPTFMRGEGDNIGLSGLLTSTENPGDHIQRTKVDNLFLLPSGKLVPNPSEILSTYRFGEIMKYVREHFDHIIVDSPPVMGIADALVLSANCDATLLVVEYSSMRTPAIRVTLDRLAASGSKVLGVVMTKYRVPSKGYLNYYQYSYGQDSRKYGAAKTGKKSKAALKKQYIDIV